MPTPVYIVCSESGSVDKFRNLVSLYVVIEKIVAQEVRVTDGAQAARPPGLAEAIKFRITAVWKGDERAEKQYEHEFVLSHPGKPDHSLPRSTFGFKSRLYRFIADVETGPPSTESGVLVVTSRLREVGTEQWHSQSYEIELEVNRLETAKEDTPSDSREPAV